MTKKILVELTLAERNAILTAMNNFLEGDWQDCIGIWLYPATIKAAERAKEKLLKGERK